VFRGNSEKVIIKKLMELPHTKLLSYFGTTSLGQIIKNYDMNIIEEKVMNSLHNEVVVGSIVMIDVNGSKSRALVTRLVENGICTLMLQDGNFVDMLYSELQEKELTGDMFNIKEAFKLLRDREYDA
jgi:hypothetical protein